MDIYEKEVNKLLKDMDELNISNEDKIIYLKLYSKMLMDKQAEVEIYALRGLCSFYAEKGGLIIGFETA